MNKKIVLMTTLAFMFSTMLAAQVITLARAEETTIFPDLEPISMLFDPLFPSVNENVMIVAQMLNDGTADAFGVKVSFFVNSSYIGCNTANVLAGFLKEMSISWTPCSIGTYNITVVVDPLDEIAESNEANNALSEFVLVEAEWLVEGIGTHFEITNSEYLNITLTSSETVRVILESAPRIIDFIVERNSSATSTVFTLSGFEPDTTYYRYQDGDLMTSFTSDSEGGYTYTQEISEPHHVFIQEEMSTLYIGSDYTFTTDIYEPIVVTANNTVIDGNGFTLQGPGSGSGFHLNRRSGVTIKNVVVKGWTRGIHFYKASGNNVSGNTIQNNSPYGIWLLESGGNKISGNIVNNNSPYGIWLLESGGNKISGNIVNNNTGLGIRLQNSTGNDISGNIVNNYRSIRIWWSDGNNVSGNTIQSIQSGIRLYKASGNDISGNIVNNSLWSIMLWWSDGNNVSGNIIQNNRYGIALGDFSWCDNIVSGNTINNSGWGMWLQNASCDDVLGNTITNSWWDGIRIWNSSSNNVSGNTIQNSGWVGIRLRGSDGNNVSDNTIQNNSDGIRLEQSDGNNVSDNTIQNSGWGILLSRSYGNTVYHNIVINNPMQAYDTNPAANDWHHPDLLEGNYWSDYPGVDDGSGTGKHAIAGDGIGDTHIPWPRPDYDYYPLVDTIPPVTEISLSGTLGLEGWWVSDLTVTLMATDDISSVAETAYSFDGVIWINYTEPFAVTTEGIIAVYYNSTDVAGNVETTKSETAKIDKSPPTTGLTIEPRYVDEAGKSIYVTSATEFTLTPTDDVSGVAHTYYHINNGDWTEYVSAFKLEGPDGPYTIDYYSVDVAGNEETPKSATVILVSLKVNSYLTDSDFNQIRFFNLVFAKDKSGGYKLVATNPGQFYENIEVKNDWPIAVDTLTIDASIPADFVLKGAVPIHIYLDGNDITDLCTIYGNTITVTNVPSGSMVYVTIHIDYALKGTIYESLDAFKMNRYTFAVTVFGSSGTPSVPGEALTGTYTSSARLIAHQKKTTVIAGFVTDANGNPIVGATVELFDSRGTLIGSTTTDENGFYYFLDIPARDYTVQVTYNGQVYTKTATAVSKELTQVDFMIEY